MKRPDTHKAGDLAENMVEQAFLQNNWVVNHLYSDYGFDLLVQYLEPEGGANSALIQVKALMSTPKWKNGQFKYRIERLYVQYWNMTPEPIYLCIVEINSSRIFAKNVEQIDVDFSDKAKSVLIPFAEISELTKNRFIEIVSEVRRWWAPVRFLKARYLSAGKDPTKDRRLIPGTPEIKAAPADYILRADLFGLVTTRDMDTQQQIERYIELTYTGNTPETSVEMAEISKTLSKMPPLDEFEIRNLINAFVQKQVNERWRPPDLLKLVRALSNLGGRGPISDAEWLTWVDDIVKWYSRQISLE